MNLVSRLYRRFRQFGGFRLLGAYIRLGALPEFFRQGGAVLVGKRTITAAYSRIQAKTIPHIRKQYEGLLQQLIESHRQDELPHEHSHKVWMCWLQGMEEAPEIVKVCHRSLQRYLPDREIVVVTQKNINQYVTFPEHVDRKFKEGKIPMAQYSDLLRLELLTRYGGTWIDATVLCTGFDSQENELKQKIQTCLNADLFFFQHLKKGDDSFHGISNWFITASSNQKVLLILRDMLYQYWKDYDCVVAYFIFHIFFTMIAGQMPEEIKKMPRVNSRFCFYLEHRLADEYDESWMKELTTRCCFHKLNGRLWKEAEGKEYTFLCKIKDSYR